MSDWLQPDDLALHRDEERWRQEYEQRPAPIERCPHVDENEQCTEPEDHAIGRHRYMESAQHPTPDGPCSCRSCLVRYREAARRPPPRERLLLF